jgi:hypothetical protein
MRGDQLQLTIRRIRRDIGLEIGYLTEPIESIGRHQRCILPHA